MIKLSQHLTELTSKCFSDFQSRVNTFCETMQDNKRLKQWTFQCELMSLLSTGNCSESICNKISLEIFLIMVTQKN